MKLKDKQIRFDLKVTKADLAASGPYIDNKTCLLATAFKRQYPESLQVIVSPWAITVDGRWFGFSEISYDRVHQAYRDGGEKFKPFTVRCTLDTH